MVEIMTETKANNWFYAIKGEQIGLVSFQEIQNLIAIEKIKAETKVWNGEGDWKQAKETELKDFFIKKSSNAPPPLAGDDIDNRFVRAVVAAPVVCIIFELIFGANLTWLYIVANVICCVFDEKKLKAAGQKSPMHWTVFLVPVYLWKRAVLLNHKKYYFWGWIAAFFLSILIGIGGTEPQVKVETYNRDNPTLGIGIKYVEVTVTSTADEITIKDIIVNRGNCKVEKRYLPKTLKFGGSISVSSFSCVAAQVEVVTDKGYWTWTYE
jgi:hypothetical protein